MNARLHDLLESAADEQLPGGITDAAIAGASSRRRQRLGYVVVVVVTLMLIAPLAWLVQNSVAHQSAPVSPVPQSGLPQQLPGPRGLPTLADAPMSAASTVYVSRGSVVAVNARTGDAAVVLRSGSVGSQNSKFADSVYLSPDGTKVVVAFEESHAPELWDLEADQVFRLQGVRLSFDWNSPTPVQFAWEPDSSAFACACSVDGAATDLKIFDVAGLPVSTTWPKGSLRHSATPHAVAWGYDGLAFRGAAHCSNPGPCAPAWYFAPGFPEADKTQGFVDLVDTSLQLALSWGSDGSGLHFAARLSPGGERCWIMKNRSYDGVTLVPPPATKPVLVTQYENNWDCDSRILGSTKTGFVFVAGLDVVLVSVTGETTVVSRLPTATTAVSFASALVG